MLIIVGWPALGMKVRGDEDRERELGDLLRLVVG